MIYIYLYFDFLICIQEHFYVIRANFHNQQPPDIHIFVLRYTYIEHFQNYFYKLSIPSTEKDQETIVDFNKNLFTKLSISYLEFIKKNNIADLIDPFINFDRKYMIDDLFHSLSDLLSISSLEVDSTRSIFNRGFKDRKRIILDSVDYDTFFK